MSIVRRFTACIREAGLSLLVLAATSTIANGSSLTDYLATWKLDRGSRAVLEEPAAWNDAKQEVVLRVLARLARAPAQLADLWAEGAVPVDSEPGGAGRVQDRMARLEGRALRVTTVALPGPQAERAGRETIDVVRIVTSGGLPVDVITERAPRAWPRGVDLDERAAVVGLPLAESGGPPTGSSAPARLLLATTRVSWLPSTPLGSLGMDYGLFDTVEDGQRLVSGDTEAFYAMLAAAGRADDGAAATAGTTTDIVPLIDPGQRWFEQHRGSPLTIEGVARRAIRIEVDDPRRRRQLGLDHYWEVFVFVPTPLIKVNERLQQDYPVVCCVRSLPPGMPTGQRIGERVRVSGFALKRYGYPLPDLRITSSQGDEVQQGQRRETALVIGGQPEWLPAPTASTAADTLGWAFLALAALVALALAVGAWALARDSRRRTRAARAALPERIDLS